MWENCLGRHKQNCRLASCVNVCFCRLVIRTKREIGDNVHWFQIWFFFKHLFAHISLDRLFLCLFLLLKALPTQLLMRILFLLVFVWHRRKILANVWFVCLFDEITGRRKKRISTSEILFAQKRRKKITIIEDNRIFKIDEKQRQIAWVESRLRTKQER